MFNNYSINDLKPLNNNKIMKKVIILCTFLILSSCSNSDDESENNPFLGIWVNNQIGGQNLTIEFTNDFNFYYSAGNQEGTYTLNGNVATIDLNTTNNSIATIIDDTHINWVTVWTKRQ